MSAAGRDPKRWSKIPETEQSYDLAESSGRAGRPKQPRIKSNSQRWGAEGCFLVALLRLNSQKNSGVHIRPSLVIFEWFPLMEGELFFWVSHPDTSVGVQVSVKFLQPESSDWSLHTSLNWSNTIQGHDPLVYIVTSGLPNPNYFICTLTIIGILNVFHTFGGLVIQHCYIFLYFIVIVLYFFRQ